MTQVACSSTVEHPAVNRAVEGSSPSAPAIDLAAQERKRVERLRTELLVAAIIADAERADRASIEDDCPFGGFFGL